MKRINYLLLLLSLVMTIMSKNIMLILLLIPLLILAIFIGKWDKKLELVYLIFLFIAYALGYGLDLYNRVYHYDSVVHFIFGIVCSIYAIYVFDYLNRRNNKNFKSIFIVLFTLALAGLWEIVEFLIDIIFNSNMQRGLTDTMKDIICALISSGIYALIYSYKNNHNKILKT